MLQEQKIQTIFDEYFPQQILPSPVAFRIKQQMQLQLSQQARPVIVQKTARQRKRVNLLLAIEQWWDASRPQFQPMPAFALTGATAVCLFLVYFLAQGNLLSDLAILQRTDNTRSITSAIPNDDTANQMNVSREPEVLIGYPTIDDMRIADDLGADHAVAMAPTATPMQILPTPLPQTSSEQIILRPTARAVDAEAVLPAAMDHPPSDDMASSFLPTAQEAFIDLPTPTTISIAIASTEPIEPLPTVSQIVPTLAQSPIAVAINNVQPNSVAQMPTPNPDLSQAEIVLRPTSTYYPAATPIIQSIAQVAIPTDPPTAVTTSDRRLGVLGKGPSVPLGLAANSATATAQADNTSSVVSLVPTLLPPSEIGVLLPSSILPTATQVPSVQIQPALSQPVQVPSDVASVKVVSVEVASVETSISVAVEATPWPSPTETWLPSPTVLPTFTLIPTMSATETPIWVSPTPTPRPPGPTNTPIPPVQPNNNDSEKKNENKKRDEDHRSRPDPQPTATAISPVVNVPVAPTAPPPPLPPTPVPAPTQPDPEPVRPTAAALALPLPPPSPTPVPPTAIPPTLPPTQPPPTAKPILPVHTATPEPTKRLPTATPIRVEIKPVVGVPEPTPRPTAIVQQPAPTSEPVRESSLGAEPVTGKDSNPVKPIFTPTSSPDRSRPTPIRVEINPQPSAPKIIPTLTPRPTSKPIVLDSDAESDRLLGKDEESNLESATE